MKTLKIKLLTLTTVFAAAIFVFTFLLKIPSFAGYVHLGDALIYLCSALLPLPYAVAASTLAASLSDIAGGYGIYVLPTVVIKAVICTLFSKSGEKILCKRNFFALPIASIITIVGYYFADLIIISVSAENFISTFLSPQAWLAACVSVLMNLIQSFASAALFTVFAISLERIDFNKKLSALLK